jgi:hypothetical protein
VLQSPFDDLASQVIGVLADCWVRHELMLVRFISLDLLSNVFVEMNDPVVRHIFNTHNQLLFNFPFAFSPNQIGGYLTSAVANIMAPRKPASFRN